jgi:hypothetical protein
MTSVELGLTVTLGHGGLPAMEQRRERSMSSPSRGLTGVWAAMWLPGDDGEEVAVEALCVGGAWARTEEEDGERCGGGR